MLPVSDGRTIARETAGYAKLRALAPAAPLGPLTRRVEITLVWGVDPITEPAQCAPEMTGVAVLASGVGIGSPWCVLAADASALCTVRVCPSGGFAPAPLPLNVEVPITLTVSVWAGTPQSWVCGGSGCSILGGGLGITATTTLTYYRVVER